MEAVGKSLAETRRDGLAYDMVANCAHDLKTPLAAMYTSNQLAISVLNDMQEKLEAQVPRPVDLLCDLELAKSTLYGALNMTEFMKMSINRCMDYAKVMNHDMKLAPSKETIDVQETLLLPMRCMTTVNPDQEINFRPLPEELCSHIITDKQWLQENILCLASNAVKYSGGSGPIDISLSLCSALHLQSRIQAGNTLMIHPGESGSATPDEFGRPSDVEVESHPLSTATSAADLGEAERLMVLVECEDHGIGLSEEAMAKLFAPFKQAQRMAGGTGLGLFSLANRMKALKGMCGVMGRPDGGRGSLFWFAFPYKPDEVAAAYASQRMVTPLLTAESLASHNTLLRSKSNSDEKEKKSALLDTSNNMGADSGYPSDSSFGPHSRRMKTRALLSAVDALPTTAAADPPSGSSGERNRPHVHISVQTSSGEDDDPSPRASYAAIGGADCKTPINKWNSPNRPSGEEASNKLENSPGRETVAATTEFGAKNSPYLESCGIGSSSNSRSETTPKGVAANRLSFPPLHSHVRATSGTSSPVLRGLDQTGLSATLSLDTTDIYDTTPYIAAAEKDLLTILLVDDTQSILKLTSRMLQREGYHVTTATNGFEALKLLQSNVGQHIDAVLMDLHMPVMDGMETVKRYRAYEKDQQKLQHARMMAQSVADAEISPTRSPHPSASGTMSNATTAVTVAAARDSLLFSSSRASHSLHTVAAMEESVSEGRPPISPKSNDLHNASFFSQHSSVGGGPGSTASSSAAPTPLYRRKFIVCVSANSDPIINQEMMDIGFDGFIEKPFTINRLQEILPPDLGDKDFGMF